MKLDVRNAGIKLAGLDLPKKFGLPKHQRLVVQRGRCIRNGQPFQKGVHGRRELLTNKVTATSPFCVGSLGSTDMATHSNQIRVGLKTDIASKKLVGFVDTFDGALVSRYHTPTKQQKQYL